MREPITLRDVQQSARALGLEGRVVLFHCSLRAIGGPKSMVLGGAQAVIEGMLAALASDEPLSEDGTLVMPAFSADWSEPKHWENPPVPEAWHPRIRTEWPAFDPALTPTLGIGRVAELFRTHPCAQRSEHPQSSFAALGPAAHSVVAAHPMEDALGDGSPLGVLEKLDALVVMAGAPFESCTAFHLGEARAQVAERITEGAAIKRDGERVWREYETLEYNTEGFTELGERFAATDMVREGKLGRATCRVFRLEDAARFAEEHLAEYREAAQAE